MNSHKHARLTPKGRALLVERVLDEGWSVAAASQAGGVSRRTAYKWIDRFKEANRRLREEEASQAQCQKVRASMSKFAWSAAS